MQLEDPEESEDEEDKSEDSLTKTKGGPTKRGKAYVPFDEKKEITRGRMGIMLPEKNSFEFVHRPRAKEAGAGFDKKKDGESGRAKL